MRLARIFQEETVDNGEVNARMDPGFKTFWGDTHHNSYQRHIQDPPLNDVLAFAETYLDFYTGAYYTPISSVVPPREGIGCDVSAPKGGHPSEALPASMRNWRGVQLEDTKDPARTADDWTEFQEATGAWNRPGEFIAFPGYEWQGNGRWGDHNVVFRSEGHPIHVPDTLAELYEDLRDLDAIAIPHHTGYLAGERAPLWSACDERLSPFAEIFSIHGCSETDEEWIGLRQNSHMGPGVGGGTYQDALDLGLHLGAICSTDNWTNMPGRWGHGLMACLAKELTRESLWEAFLARRVYGVTGDRIQLDFTCNGAPMGSVIEHARKRDIHVSVRGSDAIDRIEILRNGRVLATHCHQGQWDPPRQGTRGRFKLRIEPGWGPRLGEVPCGDRQWQGELSVSGGKMTAWEPCWTTRDQGVPELCGETACFTMTSRQENVTRETQGATLFEFDADPGAELVLRLNGREARDTVAAFAEGSRLLWYRDESVALVRETTGLEPRDAGHGHVYYQVARKAKIHRAVPEAGYTACFSITDDEPLGQETHYRVRVEQRNGQRAWSSPIWVRGTAADR